MLDDIAIMADPWDPDPQKMPGWRNPLDARDGLLDALQNLGIHARHVPTILRLPDDPIILPEHQRTHRTAEALALTALAGEAHGTPHDDRRSRLSPRSRLIPPRPTSRSTPAR